MRVWGSGQESGLRRASTAAGLGSGQRGRAWPLKGHSLGGQWGWPQAEATAGQRPGGRCVSWPGVVTPGTVWAQVPEGGGCESRKPTPHALLFPAPILTQIWLPSEQEGSWDLRLPAPPNSGTESVGPESQCPPLSPPASSHSGSGCKPHGPGPCPYLGQINLGGARTRVPLISSLWGGPARFAAGGGGGRGWVSSWPLPRRRHLPWVRRAHSAAVTDSTSSAHRLSREQGLAPGSGQAGRWVQWARAQGRGSWK